MPDLESSISGWRKQMLAAGIQSPIPLDELESHLRDHIEQRVKSGLTEQAAFETATQRIGKAPMLKTEFAKVQGTSAARKRITVLVPLFLLLGSLMIVTAVALKKGSFADMTSSQRSSCFAAAAALSFFCWAGVLTARFFPVIPNKRTRDAIYISGSVLVMLWWIAFFYLVLPGTDFNTTQLFVTFVWAYPVPYGIFAGIMTGLEKAAARPRAVSTL